MIVKLLPKHHLEFLSLKGGCRGSSKSTQVKMPHCWKSHALAHIRLDEIYHIMLYLDNIVYMRIFCVYSEQQL